MTGRRWLSFLDIARRITGISTPVFGVSWNPSESTRDIVRGLVTFLEDRRVLFIDYQMEHGPWVTQSVLEIRHELTRTLQECPDDTNLTEPIRAMRSACRKFLNDTQRPGRMSYPHEAQLWVALGELRATFGLHLARLCTAYGIDVEPDLASILPEKDEDS
jgi:hypothetical protein